MPTAIIQHLSLSPTSYYAGPNSGWTTNKSNALVYASISDAQAVIDLYRMYAITTDPGTITVVTFLASGTFAVPAGVTSLFSVEAWGAGGGGGGANDNAVTPGGAGGGGGGAYVKTPSFSVMPSTNLTVTVGTGGAGGTGGDGTDTSGVVGGDTSIGDGSLFLAKGGGRGQSGTAGGAKGFGGSTAASIGTTKFAGGNGFSGNLSALTQGGGGGAGGSTIAAGQNACQTVGGIGLNGGGSGGNVTVGDGVAGAVPGGAGGGAAGVAGVLHNGAAGADGKVIITYILP